MPSHTRKHSLQLLLSVTCAAFAPAPLSAAALHVLAPVSLDAFDYALGIASDGTVIGYSDNFDATTPVYWQMADAHYDIATALPLVSGGQNGEARWISADASIIGGRVSVASPDGDFADYKPVIWTRSGAGAYVSALPRLGGASSDGSVAAGTPTGSRLVGHDGVEPTAVLWRRAGSGYSVQALPAPQRANGASFATAISADGARIAGHYTVDESVQAVIWTEVGSSFSTRVLETLAGGIESFAHVISQDGKLAAGTSDSANGLLAVKWDTSTGDATALERLPGDYGTVRAISADSHWLGGSSTDSNTFESNAVLWDHEGKIHDLVALAAKAGSSFSGFAPESVTGIHLVSTGVYTIVGTGVVGDTGYTQGYVLQNLALSSPAPDPDTNPDPDPDTDPDPEPEPENPAVIIDSANLPGSYMSRHRQNESDTSDRTIGSSRSRIRSR